MTQQSGNLSNTERTVSTLLGTALALVAARRGNPIIRALSGTASAALLARAYAGHCGMKAALTGQTSLAGGIADQWQRMSGAGRSDASTRAAQSDAIDESVDQSFPASDPPASHLPDEPPVNAEAKWRAARAAEG
jgi:Protein of unknown function (DUF2892)